MADMKCDTDLENRILKIVEKITKNRHRPCYQNINTFLIRGNSIIDENELIKCIDNLVERGVLNNIGTADKESFRVINSSDISDIRDEENKYDDIFIISDDITDQNMSTNEVSPVNDFINYKFYETLVERIKSEVIKCVDAKLGDYDISNIPQVTNDPAVAIQCKDNYILINQLKNEVEYLRAERISKEPISCAINDSDEVTRLKDDVFLISKLNKEVQDLRIELKSKDKIIEMLMKVNDNKDESDNINNHYVTNKQDFNKNNTFNKDGKHVVYNRDTGDINITLNNTEGLDDDDANFTEVGNKSNTRKKNTRTITILGDSIVKDIKGHKLKRKLAKNERIYVKSFPGATITDMKDHVRPTMRSDPDLIVLHAGCNDLRSNKTAANIASDIINLTLQMKSEKNDVIISSIIARDDNPKLNDKGKDVNVILKEKCEEYNILFIEHSNIQREHLNGSKLHLNYRGTVALANNFLSHIKI